MKTRIFRPFPFTLFLILCTVSFKDLHAHGRDTIGSKLLQFVENKGQWAQNILYRANVNGGVLFAEKHALTFAFTDSDALHELLKFKYNTAESRPESPSGGGKIKAHAYKVNFIGASENVSTEGLDAFSDYENYFLGNDPRRWASHVKKYSTVYYHELYDQIDMRLAQTNGLLKYEFIVKTGGNPADILMHYEGVEKISLNNGNLNIRTSVNRIIEVAPYVYQEYDGQRKKIPCNFKLRGHRLGFVFPEGYDKNLPLVIDPILIFSSYSGSTADNWGYTATYDSKGFLYAGGNVFNIGYPTTPGAYQINYAGASCDMALSKYDTTGTFLVFSTYLGGSSTEVPNSLIVDSYDNLFILGTTSSADFPITTGSYDQTFNGGTPYTLTYVLQYAGSDIVVSKLSSDGTNMLASTFFGGSGNDGLNTQSPLKYNYADDVRGEIMIDANDNVYIASTTSSVNLPVSAQAFQPVYGGGAQDGCIAKFDNNLSTLLWCSYLGGSGNDAVYSILIDDLLDLYVSGGTTSSDFITTPGVLQPSYNGGSADGFITHLHKNGNSVLHSTYWGSSAYDQSYFVENDKEGNIYTLGQTAAAGMTYVYNAAWYVSNGGQFISKMTAELDSLIWSTAFGTGNGGPDVSPTAFLVDLCDKIYLSAWGGAVNAFGGTSGLPVTWNAFQTTTDNSDYYFMVINDDASALHYATYFGGSSAEHVDGGTSRFDRSGKIYQSVCAGCGGISNFPTTPGAVSNTNNSFNCNNGVIKFDFNLPLVIANFYLPPVVCAPNTINFVNSSTTGGSGLICWWDFGDGTTSALYNPTHSYTQSGIYTVTLAVSDTGTCNFADTISRQVVVLSNSSGTIPPVYICSGDITQIGIPPSGDPGVTYQWSPATWISNPTLPNPFANPPTSTLYTVLVSNGYCTDTLTQWVVAYNLDAYAGNDTTTCTGQMLLTANSSGGATSFHWSSNPLFTNWLNSNSHDSTALVNISSPSWFYIMISNAYCTAIDSVFVDFQMVAGASLQQQPSCHDVCDGLAYFSVSSGSPPFNYLWSNGQTNDTIYNLCGGTYTVTITDSNGCIFISSAILINPDELNLQLQPSAIPCEEVCNGSITVTVTGGTPPYQYVWSNGQGSNPASGLCEGSYYLTVTDSRNCSSRDTAVIIVQSVFGNVSVYADKDTIYSGQSTGIHATAINGVSYLWTPAYGLSNPASSDPIASPAQTTTYYLTMTDAWGCQYLDTLKIFVLDVYCDDPYIYIPNAFTPDGDQMNDILLVRSSMVQDIELSIYNRWGEKVFESRSMDHGWDGTYKGKACDPGVFVYHLSATCHNLKTFFKKGNVTLIR